MKTTPSKPTRPAIYLVTGFLVMFSGFRAVYRPGWLYYFIEMIGLILLLVGFFDTLISGFKRRDQWIYKWMVLPVFCLASLYLSLGVMPGLGLAMITNEFKNHLKDFDSAVVDIRAGKYSGIPHDDQIFYDVDPQEFKTLPSSVRGVHAWRCASGGDVDVYFLTSNLGGGLGIHRGFAYVDFQKKWKCGPRVPSYYHLEPMGNNWYSFQF